MRSLFVGLLAASLLLAGCTSAADDPEGAPTSSSTSTSKAPGASGTRSSTSSSTSSAPAASNATAGDAPNQPPTGTLLADLNGTTVAFTLNGTDPDGDALTWTLSFGDGNATNGTLLPANVTHVYGVGNHTANFTLSDGQASKSYWVNLTVVAAPGSQAVILSGTVTYPDAMAAASGFCTIDLFASVGTGGTAGETQAMDPKWVGWAYAIQPDSLLVTFFTGSALPSGPSGTVPAGAAEAVICGPEPTHVLVDYTLTLTP